MSKHPHHLRQPGGFGPGYTAITRAGEAEGDTGMDFGILRLREGETFSPSGKSEGALLLLEGRVRFAVGGQQHEAERASIFDDEPIALHYPSASDVTLTALSATCELCVVETAPGEAPFEAKLFDADSMLESEHRGKGRLDDASYRIVRTIFDGRNRPQAKLVLGEVVTFPGRWSSYPPHHHPQPEIYHYRFTDPRGYGHAELGDDVLKVQQHDTIKILDFNDHSQVAAPGYGMYYIWAIRHLDGDPYTVPEFTREHAWLNAPQPPDFWRPTKLIARGDDDEGGSR
ncbi:MAG: 5-deoxy-glucuronate isomerase [Myxococcales bacterium]|nr:5-deoxy-glucuronate isomerase [Myxococcales bacterium]